MLKQDNRLKFKVADFQNDTRENRKYTGLF